MQATHLGKDDDGTVRRALDWARLGRILVQSKMCPALMVVGHETTEVMAQASLTGDQYVVQALASDRADHAFDVRTLPG
jgi:Tfp pilus assembly protein PilW